MYIFSMCLSKSALGQNDAEGQFLLSKKIQNEIITASSHCCLAKKDAVKLGINFTPDNTVYYGLILVIQLMSIFTSNISSYSGCVISCVGAGSVVSS